MVQSVEDLLQILRAGQPIDPQVFESKLGRFGEAMSRYDAFDQASNRRGVGASTVFLLFDALVRFVARDAAANICVLRLASEVDGKGVEKIFLSNAAAEG